MIILFLISAFAASPAIPPDPVGPYDFPDPAATFIDGVFYAYGGSQTMSSNDLTTWSERHPYLSRSPAWAAEGTQGGAPGAPIKISQRDDGESVLLRNSANTSANTSANRSALKIFFMMTFQAEQRECNRRVCTCIGAAFAPHPSQPFVPADTPVTCMPQLDGAIDSSPRRLAMADGAGLALYWKSTGFNTLAAPAQLWAAQLKVTWSPNSGRPANALLHNTPTNLLNQTAQWEANNGIGCIEAPSMVQHNGNTYLFYSGGDWTAGLAGTPYSIGYAHCKTPFGPCVKVTSKAPWFGPSYNDTVGPGGQEVFHDGEGQPWIVFHGWEKGKAGYQRGGVRTVRFYPLDAMPPLEQATRPLH